MKSRTVLTLGAIAGVTALVGCSGAQGDPAASGGEVTMTFWHNSTTGDGKAYWEDRVAAFEAANEGVTIEIQSIQNEDMDGRLQTAVNSGDMPDIFMARGGGKLADIVGAGAVRDLTDLISEDVSSDYGEGVFSAFTVEGAIYGMPVAVLPGGIFYSEDLFADAGIDGTPTTMSELDDAVGALEQSGVEPIALGGMAAWPAAHWYYFFALRECSQEVMESIASTLDFSDACWLAAGEDLAELAATEPFNEGFLTTAAQEGAGSSAGLIANHQAGMELMGGWNVGVIGGLTPDQQPLPDLGWFPFPEVEGGAGSPSAMMGGVDGYSCANDAPTACEAFLNFIASPESQAGYAEAFDTIPASSEAQTAVEDPALEPLVEAYESADYVVVWLDTLLGQNIGNSLNTAVVELLAGNGTPQGIVDAVTTAAQRG